MIFMCWRNNTVSRIVVMHTDPATKNNGFLTDQQKIYERCSWGITVKDKPAFTLTLPKAITVAAYYPLTNTGTFVSLHAGMNYDDIVTCLCTR